MKRRSFLMLAGLPVAAVATLLAVHLTAPTPSAAAARPAGGQSTSVVSPTIITPGSTADDVPTATPTPTTSYDCATPTAWPMTPTNTPEGPTSTKTPTGMPCPPQEATPKPCPTDKAPDFFNGGCGTFTPTPTSQRPWGADLRLVDHRPSPAVAGKTKTWTFEMENVGSPYGCEAHQVDFYATVAGQADSPFYSSATLGCHETAQVTVASIVTAAAGQSVSIDATASAGASPVQGHVSASDTVVAVGDFNCNGARNSIDATLILQLTAGLIQPFSCTGAGDVNNDGYTNPIDAFLLLQYVAGLIPPFT